MDAWKTCLNADPTSWLLQPDEPALRFLVARDLLDLPADELAEYQPAAVTSPNVEHILSRQTPAGYWGKSEDFYIRSKYKGTVWSFILLAELAANPADERIHRAGDFLLEHAQDPDGGFSYYGDASGGVPDGTIPCLTGNLAWSLQRLGFAGDPRLRRALDWISTVQRFDDREGKAPEGGPYKRYPNCWGRHTCAMGPAKALKALAAVPVSDRTPAYAACINDGVEFFLKHQVYKRSHNPARVLKECWTTFGFPRFYDTDTLEILDVLLSLGCRDPRLQAAVDLVLSKQSPDGTWLLEHSWNGRMQVRIEALGQPSRWVTYQAVKVLKSWYSSQPAAWLPA